MKPILVTRPRYDDTTFYCYDWVEEVLAIANKKGLKVIDLKEKKVTRKNVEDVMSAQDPSVVLFNGHGTDDSVHGHEGEELIKINDNESLLKDKIAHSLSCSSARKLGPASIEKGCKAYIGYGSEFVFFWNKDKVAHPREDEIAKPFFKSANQAPISLIKNRTVEETVRRTQKTYDYWITYYRLHGELLEAPQNLLGLMWNKISLVFHGNPEAKIE